MLCAFALLVAGFPNAPLADQVALGRELARKEPRLEIRDLFRSPEPRSSLSRIWGPERQVIGLWSNGYQKTPVEHVLWISPALVSRWMGFLDSREYWEDEELASRWASTAKLLGGRKTFIVQLTAFPKMPTYGVGDYERTSPEEIENVRFVYTSGERSEPMQAQQLALWESRDRSDLENFPWWQYLPLGRFLTGEFEQPVIDEPLPLGDYYRAWYVVSVPENEDTSFEVRVLSRRKERVAEFKASK